MRGLLANFVRNCRQFHKALKYNSEFIELSCRITYRLYKPCPPPRCSSGTKDRSMERFNLVKSILRKALFIFVVFLVFYAYQYSVAAPFPLSRCLTGALFMACGLALADFILYWARFRQR